MPDYFETTIKNYSGLSSETKPTIAAGNVVPNGSRWREVDTGKVYYFNESNDAWYLFEEHAELISGSTPVTDISTKELLIEAVMLLRKIDYHLSLASDVELKDYEIIGD